MQRGKGVHIVPNKNGQRKWLVELNSKSNKEFDTQIKALNYGKKLAKTKKVELSLHGLNGKIRLKNSYGKDPYPPKDRN